MGGEYFFAQCKVLQELESRCKVEKPTQDSIKIHPQFNHLVSTICSCIATKKTREEVVLGEGGGSSVQGDGRSVQTKTFLVPLIREVVAVGDFDISVDARSRQPFVSAAHLDADPVVARILKQKHTKADEQSKTAKPRVEHQAQELSAESTAQADSQFVRVTCKPIAKHVRGTIALLDVLCPETRKAAFPPQSRGINGYIIDLPYGLGQVYGDWDKCRFSEAEVCMHVYDSPFLLIYTCMCSCVYCSLFQSNAVLWFHGQIKC